MGLVTWIKNWFSDGLTATVEMTDEQYSQLVAETNIRELAFYSCVNMIANSISKCEFKTFERNKEVKGREHYLWNVEPNKNQNSSQFLHKLIYQLYKNNECLVIAEGEQLLVADSYAVKEYALLDNTFSQVQVGDYSFSKTYKMSDVLFFKLSEKDMRKVINLLYENYGKLISYGMKSYQKSRGNRGILDYESIAQGDEAKKAAFEDLMNNRFKKFFENESAVLPLPKGYSYTDIGSKTYSNEGTRDIRALMDDVSDFTAKAFGIPPALIRGEIAGINDAMQSYLTFTVEPLVDLLQTEINRKRNGYTAFTNGTYLKIDTRNIKHVDILESATSIDKLISSGCYSINQIRDMLGELPIDEEFADKFFITKNYSTAEDLLKGLSTPPPNTA